MFNHPAHCTKDGLHNLYETDGRDPVFINMWPLKGGDQSVSGDSVPPSIRMLIRMFSEWYTILPEDNC